MTLAARFWIKVAPPNADQCWEWQGNTSHKGYGLIKINGLQQRAHRVVWQLVNGPIPEGLHVLHECDNRSCVNPAHLFLGTNTDNIEDAWAKGRGIFRHPQAVRAEAVKLYQEGFTGREVAAQLGNIEAGAVFDWCREAGVQVRPAAPRPQVPA